MSETARRWAGQRERRRVAPRVRVWRPVWIAAMAASLVLIAGSVSALLLWRRPQAAASLPKDSTTALVHPAPLVAREAPAVTPTPPSAAPEPPLASQPASVRRASRALSAALLLQRATEARRRGDVAQAITLYHRLQQLFPTIVRGRAVGGAAGWAASGARRHSPGARSVRSLPARGAGRCSGARGSVRTRACSARAGAGGGGAADVAGV